MSAISPKAFPPTSGRRDAPVSNDLQLAVGDDVEAVAGLALSNHVDSRQHRDELERTSQGLERRRRQRCEERDRPQQSDLHHRDCRVAVDVE